LRTYAGLTKFYFFCLLTVTYMTLSKGLTGAYKGQECSDRWRPADWRGMLLVHVKATCCALHSPGTIADARLASTLPEACFQGEPRPLTPVLCPPADRGP